MGRRHEGLTWASAAGGREAVTHLEFIFGQFGCSVNILFKDQLIYEYCTPTLCSKLIKSIHLLKKNRLYLQIK